MLAAADSLRYRDFLIVGLIVGSEGTLGVVLEAKIRLVPVPRATALAIVHFHDEIESLRRVPEILKHHPSTVELLDELVLREAQVNAATTGESIQGSSTTPRVTFFAMNSSCNSSARPMPAATPAPAISGRSPAKRRRTIRPLRRR